LKNRKRQGDKVRKMRSGATSKIKKKNFFCEAKRRQWVKGNLGNPFIV